MNRYFFKVENRGQFKMLSTISCDAKKKINTTDIQHVNEKCSSECRNKKLSSTTGGDVDYFTLFGTPNMSFS